jgi:flagellar basal body-associated protein FliL
MAEQKAEANESKSKKSSLKVLIIVAAILFLEGVTVIGVVMFTASPKMSAGSEFMTDDEALQNEIHELLVSKGRFPNSRRGITYLYDSQIKVQVKAKNLQKVTEVIEANEGLIRQHIASVIRMAEPRHFEEPLHVTLTSQVEQVLNEIIPVDVETNESLIEGVLIVDMVGFPAG